MTNLEITRRTLLGLADEIENELELHRERSEFDMFRSKQVDSSNVWGAIRQVDIRIDRIAWKKRLNAHREEVAA